MSQHNDFYRLLTITPNARQLFAIVCPGQVFPTRETLAHYFQEVLDEQGIPLRVLTREPQAGDVVIRPVDHVWPKFHTWMITSETNDESWVTIALNGKLYGESYDTVARREELFVVEPKEV